MSILTPYEKLWDMPFGGNSDEKQAPHWMGNIIYGFLCGLFKICFRYSVRGRESLRAFDGHSGVLIVSNHTSFLDVVFMYLAGRPKQWVRLMGRENLFGHAHGIAGQILSRVGGFPIKRDSADRSAIKRATRMLKNGEVVGILPEGTRRGKGSKAPELHSGAAFIARMASVPILPMTVRNAEKIKPKGKFFRFPKVSVEYGTPFLLSDFDFLPKEDRLDGCTWFVMRESFALFHRCEPASVDMKQLFPDSKDFTDIFTAHDIPRRSSEDIIAMPHNKDKKKVRA